MELKAIVKEINIVREIDEYPDLSYYKTTPEGYYGKDGSEWEHVNEDQKLEVIKKYGSIWNACVAYAEEDKKRLESFERGDLYSECIRVVADVDIIGILQKIHSGWICGIESDNNDENLKDLIDGLIEEVKTYLRILNVEGIDNCKINRG